MVELMKKISLRVALTVGVSILFSGVTACIVWFLGNVLGISAVAMPFTLVWRYALIAFVVVSAVFQIGDGLIIVGKFAYLSWKWAPTPKSDIWEGVMKYDLLKKEGLKNWNADKFRNWLTTQHALERFGASLIRSMTGKIKL